ncbi:MAG: GGDEF domain-containing protein [Ruminococcus sp.]|nr:GGDEF domain-containing protein [Ruminococcus sp.]
MKNKKRIIISLIILIIIAIISIVTYNILTDDDKLTSDENKWIYANINNVKNINVINDVNIFGNTGSGVFYSFLTDLELDYKLNLNHVTYNYGESTTGITLGIKTTLTDLDKVFYEDHYVLISKTNEVITDYNNISDKKIGIMENDFSYIKTYINSELESSFNEYDSKDKLLEALNEDKEEYLVVPLTIYLDEILKNNYYIINHMSDIKFYYVISGANDNVDNQNLTNILNKYYNNWQKDNLEDYFNKEEFKIFASSLGIADADIDSMRSVTYNYGFTNNSPYEVIMSGNYGGIAATYLHKFSVFADVDFNYTKYRDKLKIQEAVNNKAIDLYYDYYNYNDNYISTDSKILKEYSVITPSSNSLVINSLESLVGKTVYVEQSSSLVNFLKNINNINIKSYNGLKELKKIKKDNIIIVLDKNVFDLYSKDLLNDYTEKYHDYQNETYNFKLKNDTTTLSKLFSKYIMTLDNKEMVYKGMYSHSLTFKTGNILATIAKYILITLSIFAILFIIFYKSSKKIKIAKRITKENKIKFIDQLTSLKNRNYLNEYINNWNNNTVYPQTMIVIDLNNIQFINDTLGYEEGDKQIKAGANILIKTQLDNSDIMRTDGNEFLIYLVGYNQKQVTNYIHKLNKEFKKLPYEYGAEFGYSMINDGIKTVEDAIIEATDDMKKQKKKNEGE